MRLFANMTAGHPARVTLWIRKQRWSPSRLYSGPVTPSSVPFGGIGTCCWTFVAFMQAFVFMFLTTVSRRLWIITTTSTNTEHGHRSRARPCPSVTSTRVIA